MGNEKRDKLADYALNAAQVPTYVSNLVSPTISMETVRANGEPETVHSRLRTLTGVLNADVTSIEYTALLYWSSFTWIARRV